MSVIAKSMEASKTAATAGSKSRLALDSPLGSREEECYRMTTIDSWKHLLFNQDGLKAEALPRAFGRGGNLLEDNVEASKEVLSRVGGLVIASYRVNLLPFDESVLLHVGQAAEAEIPVFVQTPYDEVLKKAAGHLPGEVIVIELNQHAEIMERLGE